ncbi:MAG: HDOD domain-containing protein [Pseudomonadota bacterium]
MRLDCPTCKKLYQIPDDRLPTGKMVSFHCPACKGFIKLDLRSNGAKGGGRPLSQTMKNDQSKTPVPSIPSNGGSKNSQILKQKILQSLTGSLPPLPHVLFKAQEVMSNPYSNLKALANVIAMDQSLTVRVLKLANSAYYGLAGKVTSIGHASVLLGSKILGEIIMMASTLNLLSKTLKGYGLKSEDLWRHSMAVAMGSKVIANRRFPELANDAFTLGIIHDAGKIMLDDHVFERRRVFQEYIGGGQQTFLSAEKVILGLDHSEIGAEICTVWGVPEPLTTAIRYHHDPIHSQEKELTYIVHAADAVSHMGGIGSDGKGMPNQLDAGVMEFLGLQEEDLEGIIAEVAKIVDNLAEKVLHH